MWLHSVASSKAETVVSKDFNICPHCSARGQRDVLHRLVERGPIISRSDGKAFHLILGDRPIAYPAERNTSHPGMLSIGFWYTHDANPGSTETVVVILRTPPAGKLRLYRYIEQVADRLTEKLMTYSRLPCLYEFDGHRLVEVSH